MSEDAIARLKRTVLFKKLDEKENSLEDHEISEKIFSVVREIAPLLERIPENMPEFTLHNADHSAKVVELMGKIIPSDTLDHLNIIEISILIYAAYLHDIGMTASRDQREEIITNSPEFAKLRIFNEELSLKFDEAKRDGDHRTATFIEDKLFTEFLRRNHVKRSHEFIKEKYGLEETPISWKGIPYYKLMQAVCDSHGLPVRDLYNTQLWRRNALVGDQNVNVQYLSVILRLADILDLDPERTPRCLLDFINPKDRTSIKEWKKHLSIIGCKISPEEINIEAECEHPIYERALREFVDMIETERKESILLTSHYKDDLAEIYRLDLLKLVTKENIRSNGEYIYSDFHFKLDFRRVIDLLMGERLYGDPTLTLRELLQNSVDAVRYRESMEKKEGNPFPPFIKITLKDQELIIEDNGIGMDEYIFENYFLQIGKSYYNSSECRSSGVEVDPVSEFGIGILSIFMVASSFRVESRRRPLDPLNPPAPINVEIPTAYDYFVRRPSSRVEIGTKITLSLKSNHPFSSISLVEKISEIALFIEYPITIETEEGRTTYISSLPETLLSNNAESNRSKTYLTISFDETRKGILSGVKGSVKIKDPTDGYNEENNLIAQRGFLVKNLDIFPAWVNIRAAINLSNKAKLKLTPDRCKAIRDKRYTDLVSAVESEILESITSHLKEYRDSHSFEMYVEYINELLKKEVLLEGYYSPLLDPLNEEFMKFYFENVPLPCVSSDGKQIYQIINDFDSLPCIAVTGASDWENKIISLSTLEEISRLIGRTVGKETPLLLYDYPSNHSFSYMMRKKFYDAPSMIYVTSNPGVVIRIYSDKLEKREHFMDTRGFTYVYNYDENSSPLFVNSPELGLNFDEFINYNAKHPLISPFLDGFKPKNVFCKNTLELLCSKIEDILNQFYAYIPLSSSSFYDVEYSQNLNFMLIGILKKHPEILDEFSSAVKEFWEEAIETGAISSDENFPGFSERDLPWFWDYNNE